jgi:hypothetical protein
MNLEHRRQSNRNMARYDTGAVYGTFHYDAPDVPPHGATGHPMADIALGLRDLTRNEKKTLARSIKTGLTGNAHFPSPSPTPAELEAAVAATETQEARVTSAEGQLGLERDLLRQSEAALDAKLTASATNAMDTTTDETKLRSANYPIQAAPTAVGILDAPENVHVSDGDTGLSADVAFNARRKASGYVGEIAEAEAGPYRQVYIGTRSRFTIPGLDATKQYFVRVCTQATAGMGRWSDPVAFRVR